MLACQNLERCLLGCPFLLHRAGDPPDFRIDGDSAAHSYEVHMDVCKPGKQLSSASSFPDSCFSCGRGVCAHGLQNILSPNNNRATNVGTAWSDLHNIEQIADQKQRLFKLLHNVHCLQWRILTSAPANTYVLMSQHFAEVCSTVYDMEPLCQARLDVMRLRFT